MTRSPRPPLADSPSARRRHATTLVMALSAVLLAVAVVAGAPVIHDGEFLSVGWSIPWWLFALTFAVTESVALHIQVRREAQGVSGSELPLVIGLFLATPMALLVGRVVGSLVVLILHRRAPWLKTTFNIAM